MNVCAYRVHMYIYPVGQPDIVDSGHVSIQYSEI